MNYAFIFTALISAIIYVYAFLTNEPVFNNIGLVVFTVAFLALFIFTASYRKALYHPQSLWLLLPIAVLLVDIVVFSSETTQVLSTLAIHGLLGLFILSATSRQKQVNPFTSKLFGALALLGSVEESVKSYFRHLHAIAFPPQSHHQLTRRVIAGILIALPILLIFVLIFVQADALFSQSIERLISKETIFEHSATLLKTLFFFTALSILFLLSIGSHNENSDKVIAIKEQDPLILSIVLILLNALFAAFNFFQVKYVLLGKQTEEFFLKNNISYADYVHEGFFQLVFACVIVAAIIGTFSLLAKRNSKKPLFIATQILLIAQTMVVASSAMKRLWLYQDAYGYTVERLHVQWFIYFLAAMIVLGFIATTIHRWKWYVRLLIIPSVAAFCLVVSVNTESLVAEKNIARYHAGEELDVHYLLTFSSDAIEPLKAIEALGLRSQLDEEFTATDRLQYFIDQYRDNKSRSGWRYTDWHTRNYLGK